MISRWIILLFLTSQFAYSQSRYKAKFLFSYDFPNRHQIGIKLLANKPFSFTLKGGYQIGWYSIGSSINDALNYEPSVGLNGPLASIGTELNFKNPYNKFSLEYELASLVGDFQTLYQFNVGKDYRINLYSINCTNQLLLLGYKLHFKQTTNFSLHFKIGAGYRHSNQSIYYSGSRHYDKKYELKDPINSSFNNCIYNMRIGLSYCFGHDKFIKHLNTELKNKAINYLRAQDSTITALYDNYQTSPYVKNFYRTQKRGLKKYLKRHDLEKDSVLVEARLEEVKRIMNTYLFQHTMKPGTYKKEIITSELKTKTVHIKVDYYHLRKHKKFKELYEKNRLN